MLPGDGRDSVAPRSRADVLEERIESLSHELAQAWSKNFSRHRVEALLDSIVSCRKELRTLGRVPK